MKKYVLIDNYFNDIQLDMFSYLFKKSYVPAEAIVNEYKWFNKDECHDNMIVCEKLIDIAQEYYPEIQDMIGYEFWAHKGTRPLDWHFDKDEIAFEKRGINRFPICSLIFYLEVDLLEGGNLLVKPGMSIEPMSNRLVILAPGTSHYVEKFTGNRIGINRG